MSRFILLISLIIFSSFNEQENSPLPSVDVKKLDGSSFNTADISNNGKPIILCIWEISCRPCIQEFDNFAEKYKEWQSETGLKVVAISVDDNRNYNKISQLVKSKAWPFDFYQDKNQDIKRALGISSCPFTIVLNGKGEIAWRKNGYMQGDEDIAYQIVLKLINGEKIDN